MTPVAFPSPGTKFGPDAASLDALREVLRAWPGRGWWDCLSAAGDVSRWCEVYAVSVEHVEPGDTWTLVRDTAEPGPAGTVTVRTWEFALSMDDGGTWSAGGGSELRSDTERCRANAIGHRWLVGPVVAVDRALTLPVEPAVVVGEVSDAG